MCLGCSPSFKHFLKSARDKGVIAKIIHEEGNEKNTLLSATIQVEGEQINSFLFGWIGTIHWIDKSPYEDFIT